MRAGRRTIACSDRFAVARVVGPLRAAVRSRADLQLRHQGPQRLASMTQRVFLHRIQLRGSSVETLGNEYGVITKASQPPWLADQAAVPCTARQKGLWVRRRAHKRYYTLVTRRALFRRDIPQFAEPFFTELNAEVDLAPVMDASDLQKGLAQLG